MSEPRVICNFCGNQMPTDRYHNCIQDLKSELAQARAEIDILSGPDTDYFKVATLKVQLSLMTELKDRSEAKLAIAIGALEFYADVNNWSGLFGKYWEICKMDIYEINPPWNNQSGGKTAREALGKIRESK